MVHILKFLYEVPSWPMVSLPFITLTASASLALLILWSNLMGFIFVKATNAGTKAHITQYEISSRI